MKTNVKIVAVLMLVVCIFALCSCDDPQKKITGTWTVETVTTEDVESLADWGTVIATNLFFEEGDQIKFLSDGSFTSKLYNLQYKLVDDQLVFTYKGQTYTYTYDLKNNTLNLYVTGVASVTLKK